MHPAKTTDRHIGTQLQAKLMVHHAFAGVTIALVVQYMSLCACLLAHLLVVSACLLICLLDKLACLLAGLHICWLKARSPQALGQVLTSVV